MTPEQKVSLAFWLIMKTLGKDGVLHLKDVPLNDPVPQTLSFGLHEVPGSSDVIIAMKEEENCQ